MGRMPRRAAAALLAVLGLTVLGAVSTAAAAARPFEVAPAAASIVTAGVDDFSFESLDAQYLLSRADDGTSRLRVVETFVAVFPEVDQNRGMRRAIPDSYQGQPLFPELVSVTDENGTPRPAETDSEDGEFRITSASDDYVFGPQTYVFTYTLENVTGRFDDTADQEFYWDVNGNGWAQPFGRVTATVALAPDLAATLTGEAACYRGAYGSSANCDDLQQRDGADGPQVEAVTADLAPGETLTVAVGFAPGTFEAFDASYLASPWGWAQGAAGVGVAGCIAAGIWARRRMRDEPGRGLVIPEYTPPPRIDSLQSAVLLGKSAKAVPAEVLEQAVVGSIRIVEGGRKLFGGSKLQAELVDPSKADTDGRMLLHGLFGKDPEPGAVFRFGRQDTRFSSSAQQLLKWAEERLQDKRLRRKEPWWVPGLPVIGVFALAGLTIAFGFIALTNSVFPLVPLVLIVLAFAAIFVVSGLVSRKPLTAEGTRMREHLLGLEMFMAWAEADRIRMLQSPEGAERVRIDTDDPRQMLRLYESLLPYAVVFGQERRWAAEVTARYGGTAPYWYVGTSSGFDAAAFSSGIASLSVAASSASSSSGSGGGGSAGGGGGGGGGGGV